jgi:3-isopropylmalate dehydrogenase
MANPIATILSAALLLRYSLALSKEAKVVEDAVLAVLTDGYRTYDIMSEGMQKVGTKEMGDLIAAKI